jgi:hypothetical protein
MVDDDETTAKRTTPLAEEPELSEDPFAPENEITEHGAGFFKLTPEEITEIDTLVPTPLAGPPTQAVATGSSTPGTPPLPAPIGEEPSQSITRPYDHRALAGCTQQG